MASSVPNGELGDVPALSQLDLLRAGVPVSANKLVDLTKVFYSTCVCWLTTGWVLMGMTRRYTELAAAFEEGIPMTASTNMAFAFGDFLARHNLPAFIILWGLVTMAFVVNDRAARTGNQGLSRFLLLLSVGFLMLTLILVIRPFIDAASASS